MAKKSGLGRGLESLLTSSDTEAGTPKESELISLGKIKPNKNQPRKHFDPVQLQELADSIKQNGVLQPILVRKKGSAYEIVAGERRFQAAKQAGLKEIPVCVRNITDDEIFKLALIENLQRADLNPLEEALGYKKLIKQLKVTQEELSKVLSKSRSAISNTMRLLDLPQEIQNLLGDMLISAGHARALLSIPQEDAQIKLAKKIVEEHLSVRETEKLAPLFSGATLDKKPRTVLPQEYKRAARQLHIALGAKVKVKESGTKHKIEIEFADNDDLMRLVRRIQSGSSEE